MSRKTNGLTWRCRRCGEKYLQEKRSQHYRECSVRISGITKAQALGSDGKPDSVHYGGADNPHETIKCLEAWGLEGDALLWNAAKYISRAGKKIDAPTLRELEKAHYYLGRRIAKLKEQSHA